MAVVGFSGHQEVGVVSHEPSHISSAQFDRQTQECELFIFGHGKVGGHRFNVGRFPQRRLIAVQRRPTVESTRRAGFDIPPGEAFAWAYQAGFKKKKSRIIGVGAPIGIEVFRMAALAVYTDF